MSLPLTPAVLRVVPLFSTLGDSDLSVLFGCSQHRRFERSEQIMRAGDSCTGLCILLCGRARALIGSEGGREVTLAILRPNDVFGELALIDSEPCCATVTALERCEVLHVPKRAMMTCLETDTGAAMRLLQIVLTRLDAAHDRIATLALLNVYGRVANVLVDTAKEIRGELTSASGTGEISRIVGASPAMVSRVLKRMRERGLIHRRGRTTVLVDPVALTARARPAGAESARPARRRSLVLPPWPSTVGPPGVHNDQRVPSRRSLAVR